MRHLHFSATERSSYPVCFLVPTIRGDEIRKEYLAPFSLDPNEVLVLDLHYSQTAKKTAMADMKLWITEELVEILSDMQVEYLVVADAEYFKILTKAAKVDANLGYVMDCVYGPQKVVYVPNFKSVFFDPPKVRAKIAQGITALIEHRQGAYQDPGKNVIKFEEYPLTEFGIGIWLDRLLAMDCDLSCDIEAFDLKHYKAGLGSIAFAWNKHEGIAFPVDYFDTGVGSADVPYGVQVKNPEVRALLKSFFERFALSGRKLIFHNISYDAYVLIYQLWMEDILDTEGLLAGLEVLLGDDGKRWDCTKLISYLATNSCAGNKLGLKDQSQEFAGNYAVESIKDICRIPLPRLLSYNLVDCLSTWYVREKHWDTMVTDQQLDIYETLFKPSTVDIIQMQLTGLPINMERVKEVRGILEADEKIALSAVISSPISQRYIHQRHLRWVTTRNQELKVKRVTLADALVSKDPRAQFNPGSADQLRELIYGDLQLPVIAYTKSKQASTKTKVLGDLMNHTTDPEILAFLEALQDYSAVAILLETFVPAMENAALGPDGWHYLFGNFNLGGTISGRLSSSDPNLQNIPMGGEGEKTKKGQYGKLIKSCIEAPPGFIFAGLDFASLEDRISALTTKDPNKLKVYTDGYDGHSLRAHAYFSEQMPDIDGSSVESVNSIQKKYKPLRDKSKVPTFLLTYGGTRKGLETNAGFEPEQAIEIEARYHELYQVSDQWVASKLNEAAKTGYVTAAFGLRVRTPLLHQVIRGNRATPYEAESEGRSAGNALGQSWCLLNSRAGNQFMRTVRKSEHRLTIRPCAQIHDAQYYLLRDDVSVVSYTNEHLVQAVKWQDHPDIAHDEVKLGGELSVFWPTWAREIGIPNGAAEVEIPGIIERELAKQSTK
jgi:DNA polymerase-1